MGLALGMPVSCRGHINDSGMQSCLIIIRIHLLFRNWNDFLPLGVCWWLIHRWFFSHPGLSSLQRSSSSRGVFCASQTDHGPRSIDPATSSSFLMFSLPSSPSLNSTVSHTNSCGYSLHSHALLLYHSHLAKLITLVTSDSPTLYLYLNIAGKYVHMRARHTHTPLHPCWLFSLLHSWPWTSSGSLTLSGNHST